MGRSNPCATYMRNEKGIVETMATEKTVAVPKAAEKKAPVKTAVAARKPAAKKAAVPVVGMSLQFGGIDVKLDEVRARALEAVKAAGCEAASVDVYVKPEDGVAYWVGHGKDGDVSGSVPLRA